MRTLLFCLSLLASASPVAAQEGPLGLAAPEPVAASGLLQYVLPRFSLKTGLRVVADPGGDMVLTEDAPGTPVFAGGGKTWHLRLGADPRGARFLDWLTSDIGKRTVDSFQRDGVQPFSSDVGGEVEEVAMVITGDAVRGAELSRVQCARCHVIGSDDRNKGIGSTPSFAVLRSLSDWDERFQTFYVRNPHPAFTQVDGVTEPFDITRPSPVEPVRVSADDIDAILAFVAAMTAADLGAPLHLQ